MNYIPCSVLLLRVPNICDAVKISLRRNIEYLQRLSLIQLFVCATAGIFVNPMVLTNFTSIWTLQQ